MCIYTYIRVVESDLDTYMMQLGYCCSREKASLVLGATRTFVVG